MSASLGQINSGKQDCFQQPWSGQTARATFSQMASIVHGPMGAEAGALLLGDHESKPEAPEPVGSAPAARP